MCNYLFRCMRKFSVDVLFDLSIDPKRPLSVIIWGTENPKTTHTKKIKKIKIVGVVTKNIYADLNAYYA